MKKVSSLMLAGLLLLSPFALSGCGQTAPPAPASFRGGYGEASIPADTENETYYIAGYRNDVKASGILDLQKVKAFLLDTGGGSESVMLISVDCVALSSGTVAAIRKDLTPLCEKAGCANIQVISTHDHAGADTLGLWGPVGMDGKNASFMVALREAAKDAARQAVESLGEGELYFGSADTAEGSLPGATLQEDTRKPDVFDSCIYSFRFVPKDPEKAPVRLLNYAAHAESLDAVNSKISADYPAVVAQKLWETEGSHVLWFPGAIGGLLRTRFMDPVDLVHNRDMTGGLIADFVLGITNEKKLDAALASARVEFDVPCENTLFLAMKFLGVLDHRTAEKNGQICLHTELNWLNIGGTQILLVPGEVFPELIYGGDPTFDALSPGKALPPIQDLFGDGLLIFGMANDEVGYIVAPDNFLLNEERPYLDKTFDRHGENHYEETNSPGPESAACLYEAARKLAEQLKP